MKEIDTRGRDLLNSNMYGLSIREYFAVNLMNALVSNSELRLDSRLAAKFAVKYADQLVEELNDPSNI